MKTRASPRATATMLDALTASLAISMHLKPLVQAPTRLRSPWWTVVAMAVAMGVSGGAIAQYALGLLIKGLVSDLSWSRGGASRAISAYLIGLALSVPLFGWLVDRIGARLSAALSIALFAAALGFCASARSSNGLIVRLAFAGLAAGGTTVIPYVITIASRFTEHRGLALGIGAAGVGLGGLVLPLVMQHLLLSGGWRAGFMGLAVIVPLVALPGAWATLRASPLTTHAVTHGAADRAPLLFRARAFWIIGGSILLVNIGVGGVMVHAMALMTDRGSAVSVATRAISSVALASIIGRVIGGYLMDMFHAPYVSAGFFFLAAIALAFLLRTSQPLIVLAGLVCIGFTAGSEADAVSYLSARYLAVNNLGRANGLLILLFNIANALGVSVLGTLFDSSNNYSAGLAIAAGLALCGAVLITRLGPYPTVGPAPEMSS